MTDAPDQPTPKIVMWPTDEEARRAFEEYCMAVGKVCHAWNYLHEKLGILFGRLSCLDREVALNVWYSKFQDRWQRDELRRAVNALSNWPNPPAKDDVIWLIDCADAHAEDRNNAIHAPCSLYIGGRDDGGTVMGAAFFSGHPRAQNLRGRKILAEFDWCEKYTEWLTRFAVQLESAVAFPSQYPWPKKAGVAAENLKRPMRLSTRSAARLRWCSSHGCGSQIIAIPWDGKSLGTENRVPWDQ